MTGGNTPHSTVGHDVLVAGAASRAAALLDRDAAFSVTEVPTAAAARDRLADGPPPDCVVVTDALRDDADALALVADVRDAHPGLPVVFATTGDPANSAADALDRGATDVASLTETPADDAVLANRVARVARAAASPHAAPPGVADSTERNDDGDGDARVDERTLLTQLFEQIPVSLYIKDTEGRHRYMSEYDIDPERVHGKTDVEVYGADLGTESYADDLDVIRTGDPLLNKEEYNPENGEWTLTSKVPWYGPNGEIRGLVGVTRFITEKKQYEQELNRKNERLEEFANVVSHDLRNPLNVASGHLAIARDDPADEHFDRIADAHDRMAEILDDLLTLARTGQAVDDTEPVALDALAEAAWATVDTADATLDATADVRLDADPGRLRELLENLFRNSVEHSETGTVTVTVGGLADADGFYVADDGPGVPDAVRDDVFDSGFTTRDEGTGFGLAIAKTVADAHGWTVSLAPPAADRGARFEIRT